MVQTQNTPNPPTHDPGFVDHRFHPSGTQLKKRLEDVTSAIFRAPVVRQKHGLVEGAIGGLSQDDGKNVDDPRTHGLRSLYERPR